MGEKSGGEEEISKGRTKEGSSGWLEVFVT